MIRIVSVALLLVGVLSGSASAECAWVLWEEKTLQLFGKRVEHTTDWILHGAGNSRPQCEIVQEKLWRIEASSCDDGSCPGTKVSKVSPTFVSKMFPPSPDGGHGYATSRFVCLPDTVDPRGPKGK